MDSRGSLNVLMTKNVSALVSNQTPVFPPKPRLLYFDSYCLVHGIGVFYCCSGTHIKLCYCGGTTARARSPSWYSSLHCSAQR